MGKISKPALGWSAHVELVNKAWSMAHREGQSHAKTREMVLEMLAMALGRELSGEDCMSCREGETRLAVARMRSWAAECPPTEDCGLTIFAGQPRMQPGARQ